MSESSPRVPLLRPWLSDREAYRNAVDNIFESRRLSNFAKYCRLLEDTGVLGRHTVVAARSIVLPGVTLGEGAVLGALSLAKESLPAWHIYGGVPARDLGERSRDVQQLEKRLRAGHDPSAPAHL